MPNFLMNYGGPVKGLTKKKSEFQNIIEECESLYGSKKKSISFTLNGLDVTYYMIGVHRMVQVELPEQVLQDKQSSDASVEQNARDTERLFNRVYSRAGDFNTGKYKLLQHNCVTASANVLENIEPKFADKESVVPLMLDRTVLKQTEAQQLADEIFRGVGLESQKDSKEKDFTQSHVAHEIWEKVMPLEQTPKHHQTDLKQKLQAKQPSPQDKVESHASYQTTHKVWTEVMTDVSQKSHQQALKDKLQQATQTDAQAQLQSKEPKMGQ